MCIYIYIYKFLISNLQYMQNIRLFNQLFANMYKIIPSMVSLGIVVKALKQKRATKEISRKIQLIKYLFF